MYAKIVVDIPDIRHKGFDYRIPERLIASVKIGCRVLVPLGNRVTQGFVVDISSTTNYDSIKDIKENLDLVPSLSEEMVNLSMWMSQYYSSHLFRIMQMVLPFHDSIKKKIVKYVRVNFSLQDVEDKKNKIPEKAFKQIEILNYFALNDIEEIELSILLKELNSSSSTIKALERKNYIQVIEKEIYRNPYKDRNYVDKRVELNDKQEEILREIIIGIDNKKTKPFLLHGVTGSGKTEIYLHAIEYCLIKGMNSILLVPEISLTPQMVERFKGRFQDKVAVLHSRLSQGERLDEWRRIQRREASIVIGARSAIFAPIEKLGLIIIDEEHEGSYKQEEHPKYHVRDIAKYRAEYNKATIILGSATPSLESYYKAKNNEYHLLEMPSRVMGKALPKIHLVDMREELREGNRSMFSQQLQEMIEDRLEKKEQIVLFLNRRGYSSFVMCRSCGYVIKCPHCDISLTYHQSKQDLRCHYCGYTEHVPDTCPECGSKYIRYFGTGTQKVEEELAKRFKGAKVIRMDLDTTNKKGAHEKLLNSFRNQEANILLGTQMIAKGLDFPKVTLVGVIAADIMLKLPDFRSAERNFQLLTQVSGRAGRHELSGDVVIQTYSPEHYSIQCASNHDYISFYNQEIKNREMLEYPPLKNITLVHFSHIDLMKVMKASEAFVRRLKQEVTDDINIIGPVVSPISRIKDRYRFQCMIKYNDGIKISPKVNYILNDLLEDAKDRNLLVSVDIDPYVLM